MVDKLLGVIIIAIIVFLVFAVIVFGLWLFVFTKIIGTLKREGAWFKKHKKQDDDFF